MAEVILNWAVLIASFGALVAIAWLGFRDLRSFGETRYAPVRRSGIDAGGWTGVSGDGDSRPEVGDDSQSEIAGDSYSTVAGDSRPEDESDSGLRVEYRRDGRIAHVQRIADDCPGFIGTEALPGMGAGILVRHVRVSRDGARYVLENRHGSRPVSWRRADGSSGEIAPGGTLAVDGETALSLGDWIVTCAEGE